MRQLRAAFVLLIPALVAVLLYFTLPWAEGPLARLRADQLLGARRLSVHVEPPPERPPPDVAMLGSSGAPRDALTFAGAAWIVDEHRVEIYSGSGGRSGSRSGQSSDEISGLEPRDGLPQSSLVGGGAIGGRLWLAAADGELGRLTPGLAPRIAPQIDRRLVVDTGSSHVTAAASDGTLLYLATDGGVAIATDGDGAASFLGGASAVTALTGREGAVAFATADGAILVRLGGGPTARWSRAEGTRNATIHALAWDGDTLYAASEAGLERVGPDPMTCALLRPMDDALDVAARNGTLYVPLAEGGLLLLDATRGTARTVLPGVPLTGARSLDVGLFAFGPGGRFLERLPGSGELEAALPPTAQPEISEPDVTALAEDPRGLLWVGERGDDGVALDLVDPETLAIRGRVVLPASIAGAHAINRIVREAETGVMWVATDRGALRFANATAEPQAALPAGIGVDDVSADPDGAVVALATEDGIQVVDDRPGGAHTTLLLSGDAGGGNAADTVVSMLDGGGTLCAGGLDGLSIGGLASDLRPVDAPWGSRSTAALAGGSEGVFAAWTDGGFSLVGRDGSVVDIAGTAAAPGGRIDTLYLAEGERLYAGTEDGRVYVREMGAPALRRLMLPLPEQPVQALYADTSYLFIGTPTGLMQVRRNGAEQARR
jgi:hypothetical protein